MLASSSVSSSSSWGQRAHRADRSCSARIGDDGAAAGSGSLTGDLGCRGLSTDALFLLTSARIPAALIALLVGIMLAQLAGIVSPIPQIALGLHLPDLVVPSADEITQGTLQVVIPQIPHTLSNAIIVTALVSH